LADDGKHGTGVPRQVVQYALAKEFTAGLDMCRNVANIRRGSELAACTPPRTQRACVGCNKYTGCATRVSLVAVSEPWRSGGDSGASGPEASAKSVKCDEHSLCPQPQRQWASEASVLSVLHLPSVNLKQSDIQQVIVGHNKDLSAQMSSGNGMHGPCTLFGAVQQQRNRPC
jgi:hypothetical protein